MLQILIVDDDYNIREGLPRLIDWQANGCHIAGTASDAFEALTLFDQTRPEIVITDIRMPEMDGLQLINEVKKRSEDTQFVILSAYSSFQYAREALRSEVVDYLVKPVDEGEIIEVISRIWKRLEKRQSEQRDLVSALEITPYIKMKTDVMPSQNCMRTICFIMEHYQEKIHIDLLAGQLHVNAAYLGQLFRKETGYSFRDFLNRYRIGRSMDMLAEGQSSITEIAYQSGYQYPEHFYRVFKNITGKSPKDCYRLK